jgi:sirohydrochlorin ferrochelatase
MAAIAAELPGIAVVAGFVDVQHPNTEETLAGLAPEAPVTIVPLLLSAGYHVHVDLTDSVRAHSARAVTLGGALGPDARLTQLLVQRLSEAGLTPHDTVVLAVAGSSDVRAVDDCRAVAEQLAAASGHQITLGFLSAAEPRLAEAIVQARATAPGARVVVSSYLLAPGYFQDLAAAAGGDVTTEPLLQAGSPAPQQVVDVVVDRYRTCTQCTACGRFCQRRF